MKRPKVVAPTVTETMREVWKEIRWLYSIGEGFFCMGVEYMIRQDRWSPEEIHRYYY